MYLPALFTWSEASHINGSLEIRLKQFLIYFTLSLKLNWNNSHSAHKNEHGSKSVWSEGHSLVSRLVVIHNVGSQSSRSYWLCAPIQSGWSSVVLMLLRDHLCQGYVTIST